MSLIICPECGKEFSDKAGACPNCGCPTTYVTAVTAEYKTINSFDDVFSAGKAMSLISSGCVKAARKMISPTESVYYASILNVSAVPVHGKLSKLFSPLGKINGVLAITNRRVLFVNSVLGVGQSKEIPIPAIQSVDSEKTLWNCPVRIRGLTEMFVIDCTPDIQADILTALSQVR